MALFQDQYRVESARCCGCDYAEAGTYLVTVCTKDRVHWFGEVMSERMILNPVGMIAVEEILRTSLLRNNVVIESWIVMPNHVHVIVEILPKEKINTVETCRWHVSHDVSQIVVLCRLRSHSLGSIINHIKASCTKRIWAAGYSDFHWQPLFHDRILRTDHAIDNARSYVAMNPMRWHRDRNNVSL